MRLLSMTPTRAVLGILLVSTLTGCASNAPPKNMDNLCSIFSEKRHWHKSAVKAQKRWGVPVHIPMAMMHQESKFVHDARPPKKYFLGFIPTGRVSSALGYSQALDGTWKEYQNATGNSFSSRENFDDSIDFMGWYINKTHRMNRVSKWDAYNQYLNYHEGQGGFRKRSYLKKPWLILVSKKVERRSKTYNAQYAACKGSLSKKGWFW